MSDMTMLRYIYVLSFLLVTNSTAPTTAETLHPTTTSTLNVTNIVDPTSVTPATSEDRSPEPPTTAMTSYTSSYTTPMLMMDDGSGFNMSDIDMITSILLPSTVSSQASSVQTTSFTIPSTLMTTFTFVSTPFPTGTSTAAGTSGNCVMRRHNKNVIELLY